MEKFFVELQYIDKGQLDSRTILFAKFMMRGLPESEEAKGAGTEPDQDAVTTEPGPEAMETEPVSEPKAVETDPAPLDTEPITDPAPLDPAPLDPEAIPDPLPENIAVPNLADTVPMNWDPTSETEDMPIQVNRFKNK